MTLLKRLKNPFAQQYLIEIVFPLIGFFFFDWSILIIGIYYLIDHLASQLLFFRRVHWVRVKGKQNGGLVGLIIGGIVFLLFFVAEIVGLGYVIIVTKEKLLSEVLAEFYAFAKSELWLLFPLVVLVYYFKDQFTFYMPRRFLNFDYKKMLLSDLLKSITILSLLSIGILCWIQFGLNDLIVILIFVSVKIIFDLTLRLFVDNMSKVRSNNR